MKRQWNWLVLLVLLSGTACELDLSQATGAAPVDPGTLTTQADCEAAGFTWQEDSAAEKCVEPCATASDCTDEERPFCRNISIDFACLHPHR